MSICHACPVVRQWDCPPSEVKTLSHSRGQGSLHHCRKPHGRSHAEGRAQLFRVPDWPPRFGLKFAGDCAQRNPSEQLAVSQVNRAAAAFTSAQDADHELDQHFLRLQHCIPCQVWQAVPKQVAMPRESRGCRHSGLI